MTTLQLLRRGALALGAAALICLPATLTAAPKAPSAPTIGSYDMCGTLVPGVTCPVLFLDDAGDLWLLETTGGFQIGDVVRVTGAADPFCFNICNQGNGCIFSNTIVDCSVPVGTPTCFGDGTGALCPCGNNASLGEGCRNSTGVGAILTASGTNMVANDDLVLEVSQARPNKNGVFLQGGSLVSNPFNDGILCVGNPTERLEFTTLDATGSVSSTASIVTEGNVSVGQTRYYQFWFRDGMGPCATGSNQTNGYEIVWQ